MMQQNYTKEQLPDHMVDFINGKEAKIPAHYIYNENRDNTNISMELEDGCFPQFGSVLSKWLHLDPTEIKGWWKKFQRQWERVWWKRQIRKEEC